MNTNVLYGLVAFFVVFYYVNLYKRQEKLFKILPKCLQFFGSLTNKLRQSLNYE